AVEALDPDVVRRARFVGISVPMHTALRLGIRAAERIRALNPECHLCFYGLYAALNADYLRAHGVDSVLGAEYEHALVDLVQRVQGLEVTDEACRAGSPSPPGTDHREASRETVARRQPQAGSRRPRPTDPVRGTRLPLT